MCVNVCERERVRERERERVFTRARLHARPSSVFCGIEDLPMALNSKCARFMDLSEFLLLAVRTEFLLLAVRTLAARAHTHKHLESEHLNPKP